MSPSPVLTPAATVLLVRDAQEGRQEDGRLEVLMVERTLRSDFLGGALVFPGGKVDPADAELPDARWRGRDDLAADAAELGVRGAHEALAMRVAAVRETFEEAGVLLAVHGDGTPVTAADLRTPDARAARRALIDRGPVADWHRWLGERELVLDLDTLGFWSWWVTPEGQHRRFDTRFFVASLPEAQREIAAHDDVEVTSSRWTTPAAALAAHDGGEAVVIFPTRCNLTDLDVHRTAAQAAHAARTGRCDRSRVQPTPVVVDGRVLLQHPDGRPAEPV